MGRQLSYKTPHAVKSREIESVAAEWVTAMVDFHTHYRMLTVCVDGKTNKQLPTSDGDLYIGQCPVSQLKSLLSTMKSELKKLVQHVDQITEIGQNSSDTDYTTIIGHTAVLKQLNSEAKKMLCLATLPTS